MVKRAAIIWAVLAVLATVPVLDRKSTRLNTSHVEISYAVFCLKKKKNNNKTTRTATKKTYLKNIQTYEKHILSHTPHYTSIHVNVPKNILTVVSTRHHSIYTPH